MGAGHLRGYLGHSPPLRDQVTRAQAGGRHFHVASAKPSGMRSRTRHSTLADILDWPLLSLY